MRPKDQTVSTPKVPKLRMSMTIESPMTAKKIKGNEVKVYTRMRPLVPREVAAGAPAVISMPTDQTVVIEGPEPSKNSKTFTFDQAFDSSDTSKSSFASQETVYNVVGKEVLEHVLQGYNTCILAYGQTGSGKSYTMMGYGDGNTANGSSDNVCESAVQEADGLIPRICHDLFQQCTVMEKAQQVDVSIQVSYFEIYNEQVIDLLASSGGSGRKLRIREDPAKGPFVENLTEFPVSSYSDISRYMREGGRVRTTASTKMNDYSSRSHAVFTVSIKQVLSDDASGVTEEKLSHLRLVDLAGSERANATGASGKRLREGSNINKSLSTLGRVISILANTSGDERMSPARREVIPYRDSALTWLLKESLGGNSKTAIVACVSPCDYEEGLSTLRYASTAKKIKTKAKVNLDYVSNEERDQLVKSMQSQIDSLKHSLREMSEASQILVEESSKTIEENEKQAKLTKQLESVQKTMRFYEYLAAQEVKHSKELAKEAEALAERNKLLAQHLRVLTTTKIGLDDLPSVRPTSSGDSKGRRKVREVKETAEAEKTGETKAEGSPETTEEAEEETETPLDVVEFVKQEQADLTIALETERASFQEELQGFRQLMVL